jgi:hypothetical protein
MTEAVVQLRKGLDLLPNLPDTQVRAQNELDVQMTLMATRGHGGAVVAETIARARELADHLNRPDCLVALLYFQWLLHTVRAEQKLALSFAEQMEKVGKAQNDEAILLHGRLRRGASLFYLGEDREVRNHPRAIQER